MKSLSDWTLKETKEYCKAHADDCKGCVFLDEFGCIPQSDAPLNWNFPEIELPVDVLPVQLDESAYMPERAHEFDAGLDLRSPVDILVPCSGGSAIIDTGVHAQLPPDSVGMLKSKSGLNVKHGIVSEGVIDCGYDGSITVKLYNHSDTAYQVKRGDKISQLVILPVLRPTPVQVDKIEGGERGDNGFGSTGR